MKKLLAVTMILAILAMQTGFALAEEPFSLRGVTFGASMDEVKSILGEGESYTYEYVEFLGYENIPFSKFTKNTAFICIFIDNSLVCMLNCHVDDAENGKNMEDYEYVWNALSEKYGPPKALEDEFYTRLIETMPLEQSNILEQSIWESNGVLIGAARMADEQIVFYIPKEPAKGYNTDGL